MVTAAKMDAQVAREAVERRVQVLEEMLGKLEGGTSAAGGTEGAAVSAGSAVLAARDGDAAGYGDAGVAAVNGGRRLLWRLGLAVLFLLVAVVCAVAGAYFGP